MAQQLEAFDFARRSNYPEEWLDGSIWKLTPDDFQGKSPASVRGTLAAQAERLGMKLRSSNRDGSLVVQAYKDGSDGHR